MIKIKKLNKQFGFIFSVFFFLLGIIIWLYDGSIALWAFGLSVVFITLSLTFPVILDPVRRGWLFIGKILHSVTNPLILFLMFGLIFVPVGLIFRLFRRDALGKKFEKNCKTYWINRDVEEFNSNSMKNRY